MGRREARQRLHQARRSAHRQAFAKDPDRTTRLTMKVLADWMLDPNRSGAMRSFPLRHFDFDDLVHHLRGLARFEFPNIHVASATFEVRPSPGGMDVHFVDAAPDA